MLEWDGDGYPDEASLEEWAKDDGAVCWTRYAKLVASLPEVMAPCPYATVTSQWTTEKYSEKPELEVEFHTGGWSGAESVIDAVLNIAGVRMLYYERWERGGHHWFRVPASQLKNTKYKPPKREAGDV